MLKFDFVSIIILILVLTLFSNNNLKGIEIYQNKALEIYNRTLQSFDICDYDNCLKQIDTALKLIDKKNNKDLYKNLIELKIKASTKFLLNLLASNNFDPKRVKELIKKGASLNEQDENGNTPLIWASFYGDLDAIKLLIKNGANVNNIKNIEGNTAILAALQNGNYTIYQYLKKCGARIALDNQESLKALIYASKYGYLDIVKELIKKGVDINNSIDNGKTPLMFGAEFHQPKIIEILIKKGADVNLLDTNGNNALHLVFSTPRFLTLSKFSDVMKTIELLVDAGINLYDLNKQNLSPKEECIKWQEKYTQHIWKIEAIIANFFSKSEVIIKSTNNELFEAVRMNDLNSVKNLIEKGRFNVNYSHNGLTPLLIASIMDFYEIASFLIGKGADITFIPKNNNFSAVLYSASNKNFKILNLLLANIKDVNKLKVNELVNIINLLIREENSDVLDILVKKISEHTDKLFILNESLTVSFLKNNIFLIEYFLKNGANPNCSINGNPLIFEAIRKNNVELVKLLFEYGADINITNCNGNTPLIESVYVNNKSIVEFLLNVGADVNLKNHKNKTAFEIAKELDLNEIIEIMENKLNNMH